MQRFSLIKCKPVLNYTQPPFMLFGIYDLRFTIFLKRLLC